MMTTIQQDRLQIIPNFISDPPKKDEAFLLRALKCCRVFKAFVHAI